MYKKTLRRESDETERIAGHQRERFLGGPVKHSNIAWTNHFGGGNSILKFSFSRGESNGVSHTDVPQRTEERITMTRDPDISRAARKSCSSNMSGRHL